MAQDLVVETGAILKKTWSEIVSLGDQGQLADWLPDDTLVTAIGRRSSISTDVLTVYTEACNLLGCSSPLWER